MALPLVQLRPFFRSGGRQAPIVPGETGAEDLVPVVPLVGPISAGRPPVAPRLVGLLELAIAPVSTGVGSGWRQTGPGSQGTYWNAGVSVELEWDPLTEEQWEALRTFLLEDVGLGGAGGPALRAITVDVDGEGVTDSAVELLIVSAGEDLEQLVERVHGRTGIYRIGPLKAVEVLT